MSENNKRRTKMEEQKENNPIEMDKCSESEARYKSSQSVDGPTITPSNEVYHHEPSNEPYNHAGFINIAQSVTERQECGETNITELELENADLTSQFDSNVMKMGEEQVLDSKETHSSEKTVILTQEVIETQVVMKGETSGLTNDKNAKQIPSNLEVNEIHANSSETVPRNETDAMQFGRWFEGLELQKGVIRWFKQWDLLTKFEKKVLFLKTTLQFFMDKTLVLNMEMFAVREYPPWDIEPFIRLILNDERQKGHFLVWEDFRLASFGYYFRNNIPGPVVLKLARHGYYCEPDGTVRCSKCYVELPLTENDRCVEHYRCCHMHRHENISIENNYGQFAPDWILGEYRQNQNDRAFRELRFLADIVFSTTANPEFTQTGQMQSIDFQEESGVFSLHRERVLRSGLNIGPMIDLQANREVGFLIQNSGSVRENMNVLYRDPTMDQMNNTLINYLRDNPGGVLNATTISTVTGPTNGVDNEQNQQQEASSISRQTPVVGELGRRGESITYTANEQTPEGLPASNQRYPLKDETSEMAEHRLTEDLITSNEQLQQQQHPVNSEVNLQNVFSLPGQSSQPTENETLVEPTDVETTLPSSRLTCESCEPALSRRQDGSYLLRSRSPTKDNATHLQKEKKHQQQQEKTEIQESGDFNSLQSLASTVLHPEEQQPNRTSAAKLISNHTIDNEQSQQQESPSINRQIPGVGELDQRLESKTNTANEQMPERMSASNQRYSLQEETCEMTAHSQAEDLFPWELSNEQHQQLEQQQQQVNSEVNLQNVFSLPGQSSQPTENETLVEPTDVETTLPSSRLTCESCEPALSRRQDGYHLLRSRSPTNDNVTHQQKEEKHQQQQEGTEIQESDEFSSLKSLASSVPHPEKQQNRVSAAKINSKHTIEKEHSQQQEPPSINRQIPGVGELDQRLDSKTNTANEQIPEGRPASNQRYFLQNETCEMTAHRQAEDQFTWEQSNEQHQQLQKQQQQQPVNSEMRVQRVKQLVSVAIAAQKSPGLKQTSLMTSENHRNQGPHNDNSLKPTDTGSFQNIRRRHLSQPNADTKNSGAGINVLPSDCGNSRRRRFSESTVSSSWSDENIEDISTPLSELRTLSLKAVIHKTTFPHSDENHRNQGPHNDNSLKPNGTGSFQNIRRRHLSQPTVDTKNSGAGINVSPSDCGNSRRRRFSESTVSSGWSDENIEDISTPLSELRTLSLKAVIHSSTNPHPDDINDDSDNSDTDDPCEDVRVRQKSYSVENMVQTEGTDVSESE